MEYIQ